MHKAPTRHDKIGVASLNVGTLHGRAGEIAETLSCRRGDVCCVQETGWRGGAVRMVKGRNDKYKFLKKGCDSGTGCVEIVVAEKWVERVLEVRRVNARVTVLKLLFDKHILTVVSTYAPQIGLSEENKDEFWDTLVHVVSGISEREVVVIGGVLDGHVGRLAEGYEGLHSGSAFGVRNTEVEEYLSLGKLNKYIW